MVARPESHPAVGKVPAPSELAHFAGDRWFVLQDLNDPRVPRDPKSGLYIPTIPVYDHVVAAGVSPDRARLVISSDSKPVLINNEAFDLNAHTIPEIRAFFEDSLRPGYGIVNHAIAGPEMKVKNDHGPLHIADVVDAVVILGESLGIPHDELVAAIAAGELHDIGNLLGRDPHAIFSALIWRKLFPNIKMTPRQEELIDQAVINHDGDVFFGKLIGCGPMVFEEAVEFTRGELSDAALIIGMADKSRMSIYRLPPPELPEADEDVHRVINQFGKTVELRYSSDLKHLYWLQQFGNELPADAKYRFRNFVVEKDGRIVHRESELIKNGIEEFGLTAFEAWEQLKYAEYFPREMLTVMMGVAAANPLIEGVSIVTLDASGPETIKTLTFDLDPDSPNYVVKQMHGLWLTLPKAKREKPEYRFFENLWVEYQRRKRK